MQSLTFTTEQKQTLSHRTLQNIEILQMNSQQLESYINELMLENPVIEPDYHRDTPTPVNIEQIERPEDDHYVSKKKDSGEGDVFDILSTGEGNSLKESVQFQLIPYYHNEKDKTVLYFLSESLDANGYLSVTPQELCSLFHISATSAREYLSILQSLEPAGIGASSVEECLLLQLARISSDASSLASRIIREHFQELQQNKLPALAKELQVSTGQVRAAVELIRTLNPHPGNGYSASETDSYIQPDVIVFQKHNNYQIALNQDVAAGFKFSEHYRQLLNHPDKEVREYLYQKFQQAEWIHHCLEQRNTTLLRIAQQIIVNQREFFSNGPDYLRPFSQSDLARQLDLNDSTISRAIHEKYLECFWGVFPLKYFFTNAVSEESDALTPEAVKARIRSLIAGEDARHPLSDQKIAQLLEEQGIHVSRRTVAKYRMELLIPDSAKRREY